MLAVVKPGDVVVAAKMDRMFRSASNALQVIEDFKKRAANKDARCPVDSGQQASRASQVNGAPDGRRGYLRYPRLHPAGPKF